MIKPAYLWTLCKTCTDSKWIGDVCRSLGGQAVDLDFGQQQAFNAIKTDSGWMDERLKAKREKWREQKRNQRGKFADNADNADNADISTVRECPPPSVHPSVHPSIHPSNTPNGVCDIPAPAPARGDVPALSVVVAAATSVMGVPEYYARWWYGEMNARDWRKTDGGTVGNGNWRAVLKSWWNRATESEKAEIKADAEKPATIPATFSADDWQLCAERCAHCGPDGCRRGVKTPPQLDKSHPHAPEECQRYAEKREIQPSTPFGPSGRATAQKNRTDAPQGRNSPPTDDPADK